MRKFVDNVYIGNRKDAGDKKLIADNNIKVIMNVCSDIDTPYNPNVVLLKWGLDDPKDGLAPGNYVDGAVAMLNVAALLAGREDGNLLIHCASGHNRSSLVAAIWANRFKAIRWSEAVRMAQVKDKKPWMIDKGFIW